MKALPAALALLFMVPACASVPHSALYYDEDDRGRYYKTEKSVQLRVDPDGTVRIAWDGKDSLQPPRVVGRVSRVGEADSWDWDLTEYEIVRPTGACLNWFTDEPGVSCWNLLWEVPSSVVAAPFYLLYKGLELRLGLYQSREMQRVIKDYQTCSMQQCSQEEKESIQQRFRFAQALGGLGYAPGYRFSQQHSQGMPQAPLLGPVTPNAYGPGLHSDATGRPFSWQPGYGGPALGPITPNAYGPGIGMDSTGRPVRPTCPPGMITC